MRQSTKRFASLVIGLILLLASLVIYFQLIQPAYDEVQGIKSKLISEQAFLDEEKDTISQVQKLISSYQSQADIQQAVSAALPISEDTVGAIAQLSGIAAQSALSVQSVSVAAVVLSNKQAGNLSGGQKPLNSQATFQDALQKQIGTISLQLKLTGGYESLKNFIKLLETNLRIFDVKSILIQSALPPSANIKGQDLFNYEIGITTYYQGQQ